LFADAQRLLSDIVAKKRFTARAVTGFWAASSINEDVEVYKDARRKEVLKTLHFLRQQREKSDDEPYLCLADFVAPKSSGREDFIGGFAVTTGKEIEEYARSFELKHDDYSAIMVKALGDRMAEALAELMHKKIRSRWGYEKPNDLSIEELITEKYRGIRPAPGYPACPDHTEKALLWELLDAEKNTGIKLTENFIPA
jgi:5-methyltetrahydrofolate--homocysteine methyltransferase